MDSQAGKGYSRADYNMEDGLTGPAHLLAPLNVTLSTLGNDHVSVAELLGFVTGAAGVWLTVLARVSNFPVGIANSAFFLVLFASARLFADSGLQVVYSARVVVVGAESTGTSAIAELLGEEYRRRGGVWARTRCVTEAGRDYTVTKWQQARAEAAASGRPDPALDTLEWTPADFDAVAAEQTRRENEAAAAGSPLLVCDTDAFATSVWKRRYTGGRARGPQPWATTDLPRHDVYLLTSHEGVPWQDDGLREGDLGVRAEMTGWFARALTAAGHSWVLLTGSMAARLALAVRVTDAVLARRAAFGPAITDAALASDGGAR